MQRTAISVGLLQLSLGNFLCGQTKTIEQPVKAGAPTVILRFAPAAYLWCCWSMKLRACVGFTLNWRLQLTLIPTVAHRQSVPKKKKKNLLTPDVELYGGVGHPHHVLRDAGQLKVVVVSADVEKGQVDGVDVGPVYVWLCRHTDGGHKQYNFLPVEPVGFHCLMWRVQDSLTNHADWFRAFTSR